MTFDDASDIADAAIEEFTPGMRRTSTWSTTNSNR